MGKKCVWLKSGCNSVVDATGIPKVMGQSIGYTCSCGNAWLFGVALGNAWVAFSPYKLLRTDLLLSAVLPSTAPSRKALS